MFTLVDLPYAENALEPVISARTISFHHGKHLQGYVDNLNKLIAGTEYEGMELEGIVAKADGAIFNNAGQILNHNLYFTQFCARGAEPDGESALLKQIVSQWGTLDAFKAEFAAKGAGLFGSGWVWLAAAPGGALAITQEPGAGNPVTRGLRPILTFDVWEHAYYLDWQNRRPAYLEALWKILDWKVIEKRFA